MKKLFYFLAAAIALTMASCEKPEPETPGTPITVDDVVGKWVASSYSYYSDGKCVYSMNDHYLANQGSLISITVNETAVISGPMSLPYTINGDKMVVSGLPSTFKDITLTVKGGQLIQTLNLSEPVKVNLNGSVVSYDCAYSVYEKILPFTDVEGKTFDYVSGEAYYDYQALGTVSDSDRAKYNIMNYVYFEDSKMGLADYMKLSYEVNNDLMSAKLFSTDDCDIYSYLRASDGALVLFVRPLGDVELTMADGSKVKANQYCFTYKEHIYPNFTVEDVAGSWVAQNLNLYNEGTLVKSLSMADMYYHKKPEYITITSECLNREGLGKVGYDLKNNQMFLSISAFKSWKVTYEDNVLTETITRSTYKNTIYGVEYEYDKIVSDYVRMTPASEMADKIFKIKQVDYYLNSEMKGSNTSIPVTDMMSTFKLSSGKAVFTGFSFSYVIDNMNLYFDMSTTGRCYIVFVEGGAKALMFVNSTTTTSNTVNGKEISYNHLVVTYTR